MVGWLVGRVPMEAFEIVLFYNYCAINNTESLRKWQRHLAETLELKGRVLIAEEGINGTLGGTKENIDKYIFDMETYVFPEDDTVYPFKGLDWKRSTSAIEPFPDLKVAVVKEVVSTGGRIRPPQDNEGGIHLSPEDFHAELEKTKPEDLVLIDVRNNFEYQIGHFEGAINPDTRTFCEFPKFLDDNKELFENKKKVQILCYALRNTAHRSP